MPVVVFGTTFFGFRLVPRRFILLVIALLIFVLLSPQAKQVHGGFNKIDYRCGICTAAMGSLSVIGAGTAFHQSRKLEDACSYHP